MYQSFRQSMAWLHTWFGLVLGFVLMACFFFGSLSVFDREIDRWAIPSSRFEPQPMPRFDTILGPAMRALKPNPQDYARTQERVIGALPAPETLVLSSFWAYTTHRDPVLVMGGEFAVPNQPKDASDEHQHVHGFTTIDPRTGAELPDSQLKIGSRFFYPMHYSLHLRWMNLGYWIVGLAALVMLAALVSGVVMHRKIFRELFTFRPHKRTQRSALDLHNLTGVVALPFHFFFAFTGLVIFAGIYLPVGDTLLKPLHDADEIREAERTGLPHDAAGVAAPLASVDAMVAEAKRIWAERDMAGEVGSLRIEHLDDANGYVSVYRAGSDRVALVGEGIHFKAGTGELLRADPPRTAVSSINEFLTGLHLQHFEHWLLRWLYFVGGIAGCVCIATGFIFFVEKRKRQHAARGESGARCVDALAVTTVTGMLIATVTMLVANRLLPVDLPQRGDWEQYVFWGAWLLAAAHAFWRTAPVLQARIAPAWAEQSVAVALLAVLAVILNWTSTGDHLLRTIGNGYWPVAGVDLTLLGGAVLAVVAANRLRQRAAQESLKLSDVEAGATTSVANGRVGEIAHV
ncbi:MAG: PepSY-associated TM helix domain-containing protein [Spongiibacteraceae bacterium]